MTARFLVAKYAPNLKRMEPRNIGVITWLDGDVDARFAGEDPETMELAALPRHAEVKNRENYWQWIASWRMLLNKPFLEIKHGEKISRMLPEYVDAIREWSKGHYLLVDGGFVAEPVSKSELHELTNYLYDELVAVPGKEATIYESERLKVQSKEALELSGILERNDLMRNWPAPFKLYDIPKSYEFDYALGPTGIPYTIYQKVVLSHQKSFDSVVLNIHAFTNSRNYPINRFFALVSESQDGATDDIRGANKSILSRLAQVVDVSHKDQAIEILRKAATLNGQAK